MKPNPILPALLILVLAGSIRADIFPAHRGFSVALGKAAADTGRPVVAYPAALIYVAGSVPTAISPVSVGGPVTAFAVIPDLTAATGLSVGVATGVINGTRLKPLAATDFKIVATGPGGTDTAIVQITVKDGKPVLSYAAPPPLVIGKAMTPLSPILGGSAVAGYTAAVTGYAVVGTALPAGLTLDPVTGILSGTPTTGAASAGYRIAVTGPGGSDTATVTLLVHVPPSIAYPAPPKYLAGAAITPLAPVSTGGVVSGYALLPGSPLPRGLALNSATGQITGTPTIALAVTTVGVVATGPGGLDTAYIGLSIQLAAVKTSSFLFTVNGQDKSYPFVLSAENTGRVTLSIADPWGNVVWSRTVTVRANDRSSRELVWDGRSLRGKKVPAGVYVARVVAKR
jgi:hypothetical protein